MAKVIGIASAKGGVGKTTITANLGAALASEFGKNVLLIDGNITAANLAYYFGLNYTSRSIADIHDNKKDNINKCIYFHTSGVNILPSPMGMDSRIDPRQIEYAVDSLRDSYDFILLDSPPSLGRESLSAIAASNEIISITTPDIPSTVCTAKTIEIAGGMKKKVLGVVLNQRTKRMYDLTYGDVQSLINTKFISRVPYSEDIPKSIALQTPVVLQKPNLPVSIEFKKLAAHIAGIHYKPKGLFYNIKKMFGLVRESKIHPVGIEKRKEIQRAKVIDEVMKKVLDTDKLKTELTHEIKTELKESMKREITEKLKQKLKEKGLK